MSSRANKSVPKKVINIHPDKKRVQTIKFLPKDQNIIACSHDGCLQATEAKTGNTHKFTWRGKERSQISAVDVSPDGEHVATGSKDGKIQVWKWDGKTAKMIAESDKHTAAANCVCWSRHNGGTHIASGFDDGRVTVWQVASGLKNGMSTDDTRLRYIHAINYSHDGTQLLVSGYDREISRLTINEKAQEIEIDEVIKICNNPEHVSSATWAWTSDSHVIVTGSTDGQGHSDLVSALVFSPNKRVLASVSLDRTLCLWDLDAKRMIGQPLLHSADLTCAAFATNGTSLATGTCNGEIYVWSTEDLLSGTMMENLNDRDGDVTARPRFNPDSPIPTRQRLPSSFPGHSLNVNARRPPPLKYGRDFFGIPAPVVEAFSTDTPSVSRRFSLSRRVKVAASRMQQAIWVPRTQLERPPATTVSLGGIQEERRQNHRQYQVANSIPPATSDQQLAGANSEPNTQGAALVRRTRWFNALLFMRCISEYPEQMD
ncbi:WD40-repeat-containing domain protein [Suillus americanus]|nr:WD40-repeat-containing domain protein [Suillus americanus]